MLLSLLLSLLFHHNHLISYHFQIAEDQSKSQFEYDQIKEEIRVAEEIKIMKDLEEKVRHCACVCGVEGVCVYA